MITPKQVCEIVKSHSAYLDFNATLIDIFENNLCKYVEEDLAKQLSEKSFEQAKHRISPINILQKVIDKLTNIYQTTVNRSVMNGTDFDAALVAWYETEMSLNESMNSGNELYNLCNSTLLYPCVKDKSPYLMVIENDRFIPIASDPLQPTKLSDVILLGGTVGEVETYWVFSDTTFFISDSNGDMRPDLMAAMGNPAGVNPIGRLPFVYANSSKRKILPKQDSDAMKIVRLIPTMLSDLNLAAMFQSFSIIYGINIDDQNLSYAPNAFWRLKSDNTTDAKPEIGTIKPQVDYPQVLSLIEAQLSMWLGTKGIRASTVGALTQDNFSSGISKIIDEMDTFEARQKQVTMFMGVEKQLWDLLLNHMHPYWTATSQIEPIYTWTSTAEVVTQFSVQLPMQSRGQIVRDIKEEYAAGFTSRFRALKKLNPELSDAQIEELIQEIEDERGEYYAGEATEIDIGSSEEPDAGTEDDASGSSSGAYSREDDDAGA